MRERREKELEEKQRHEAFGMYNDSYIIVHVRSPLSESSSFL